MLPVGVYYLAWQAIFILWVSVFMKRIPINFRDDWIIFHRNIMSDLTFYSISYYCANRAHSTGYNSLWILLIFILWVNVIMNMIPIDFRDDWIIFHRNIEISCLLY